MTQTKKLALCGVFAGLAVALLWVLSFVPSLEYALPALAGLLTLLVVAEAGPLWALGTYLTAAVLALLLLPEKTVALLYAALFGYYPAVKHLLERRLPAWVAFLIKTALFNLAVVGVYFLSVYLFGVALEDFGETFGKFAKAITLGLGNVTFWLYDKAILTSFSILWKRSWRKKLQRWMK
ncbi:MAG: hypothetical protein LBB50_05520 [Oscillospiraceae bacterium]|jgi:hypothetical protein|nr:hypothetical protein [Oscillospiraceae bacterium]